MNQFNEETPPSLAPITDIVELKTVSSPEDVKAYLRKLDATEDASFDDTELDTLLFGASCEELEQELLLLHPQKEYWANEYGKEELWLRGKGYSTHYFALHGAIKRLKLSEADVLYDFGSGYGRVVLYAGITTPATCKGIEIIDERAQVAQQAKKRFELDNVEFIKGNVLDQDFSDGNIFYLYYPFERGTFREVAKRLKEIARHKPIKIVSYMGLPSYFSEEWLRQINYVSGVKVYKSIPESVKH